jgi:hypothetical protein
LNNDGKVIVLHPDADRRFSAQPPPSKAVADQQRVIRDLSKRYRELRDRKIRGTRGGAA